MTSPAQRHMMCVSAAQTAQRDALPLRHANAYEQMLVRLNADRAKLKRIYSVEKKALHKRAMAPTYAPWVAGVLAGGGGAQDDVVMTVMQWLLDADDLTAALAIAPYALRHGLRVPRNTRPVGYLLAEEVALSVERSVKAGRQADIAGLHTALALTGDADMPDVVRARLHKVTGRALLAAGEPFQAREHLLRAMQLDAGAGVKKDLLQCERALRPPVVKPVPSTQAGTGKRGRPRKVAAAG